MTKKTTKTKTTPKQLPPVVVIDTLDHAFAHAKPKKSGNSFLDACRWEWRRVPVLSLSEAKRIWKRAQKMFPAPKVERS